MPEAAGGLPEALDGLSDPRDRRGVRHRLTVVVTAAVCAVVAGYRSYAAIAEWVADVPPAWSTGSATSPTTKTAPKSAPAPDLRSWPPYPTPPSAHSAPPASPIAAANRHHARDSTRPLALIGIT
ncbi:transposase family protein [Micromonospora sp. NPDC023737]|uniref:transposase family protein n=1 Tax=unclassified Micromonospora TaxID=2617518 RepID=UPI003402D212